MYTPCCFICLSGEVVSTTSASTAQEPSPIAKELEVVFVLRNLFGVPPSQVGHFLEISGGQHPSEWGINLCASCHNAVQGLRNTYQRILQLKSHMDREKARLTRILEQSEGSKTAEGVSYFVEQSRRWILNKTESSPELEEINGGDSPPPVPRPAPAAFPSVPVRPRGRPCGSTASPTQKFSLAQQFQCAACSHSFPNSGKLKEHAILRHPETFFPPAHFVEEGSIPLQSYQATCQRLFHQQKLRSLGNNVFGCALCSSTYFSRPPVWVHMVESHHADMSAGLRLLLNPALAQEASQQPEPPPTMLAVALTGRGRCRGRRSNAVHPPRMRCADCGTWFGTASSLCRHRGQYCLVRRRLGLTRTQRRSYQRRGRPRKTNLLQDYGHPEYPQHQQNSYPSSNLNDLLSFEGSLGADAEPEEGAHLLDDLDIKVKVPVDEDEDDFEDPLAI